MPACNESWKKCSGFWECTGAALETAGKCTASFAEDVATSWAHEENQKFRQICVKYTECLWWKYTHGKIKKEDLLGDIHGKLVAQAAPSSWAFQEPVSGFQLLAKAGKLKGGKPMSLADKLAVDWLGAEAAIDVTGWQPTANDYQAALHEISQSFGDTWIISLGKVVSENAALFLGGPPLKGIVKGANTTSEQLAQIGSCKQADWKKLAEAAVDVGVTAVAGTDSATIRGAVSGVKIGVTAATGGKIQMQDIYTILEAAGVQLPDSVKAFLECAYKSMGDYLYKIIGMALEGNFEQAAKAAAPYLVNCSIQGVAGQLSQDTNFRKWAAAAGAATSAYIKANNANPPPPPPPPKTVPVGGSSSQGSAGCGPGYVAGLKGECLRDESGCGPNQYKSLDGKCKPKGGSTTNYQPEPMKVYPAEKDLCKGPYEPDKSKRCPEYNTPFWDEQRKIAAAVPFGTGPDANAEQQKAHDQAVAVYQQQQQTQTLVLVAAAVAGLYLLSK